MYVMFLNLLAMLSCLGVPLWRVADATCFVMDHTAQNGAVSSGFQ